jgi:hypothetical protein
MDSVHQHLQIFATPQKFPGGKQNGRRVGFIRSERDLRDLRAAVSNCAM